MITISKSTIDVRSIISTIYIYIYRERERERERYTHTHMFFGTWGTAMHTLGSVGRSPQSPRVHLKSCVPTTTTCLWHTCMELVNPSAFCNTYTTRLRT